MKAKIILTDKTHETWEEEIFPVHSMPGAVALAVGERTVSNFLGFGVAITPSSCYELMQMESGERRALLEKLYGRDGLGLRVARLCIGSSDYSPEIYSYDDVENDTALAHFSVARDERYVIPVIREILEIAPELYFFASPWSPPAWMKTGGSMCGGYMRAEFLDCYADYVLKFIEAYASYGIRVRALTPQNEPNTQQTNKMPSCVWHPDMEADFVKILRRKLDAKRLDVKIWLFDHCFSDIRRVRWQLENHEGLRESLDGVAFHYYSGAVEETACLRTLYPELGLHFTEGGPRLSDHYADDWCKWGLQIARALKAGYRSFTGWNLILNERGGPNVGPFIGTCAGLLTRDRTQNTLLYSGQYKAFAHIAPYLTPTADVYPIGVTDAFGQCLSAYPSAVQKIEGFLIVTHDERDTRVTRKIAVLVNPNARGVQAVLPLGGVNYYLELPAESIGTVILAE